MWKALNMTDDPRKSESSRREAAFANRGEVVEDSGEPLAPKRMSEMISVRLDAELVASLRALAAERHISLSDILRSAAVELIAREQQPAAPTIIYEVHTSLSKRGHRSNEFSTGLGLSQESNVERGLVPS